MPGAKFAPVGRVSPCLFTTRRSLCHRSINALPLPVQTDQVVVFSPSQLPDLFKNASGRPLLKVVVSRTSGSQLRWNRVSLTTGSQAIENCVRDGSQIRSRSTTLVARAIICKQLPETIPELLRHSIPIKAPSIVHDERSLRIKFVMTLILREWFTLPQHQSGSRIGS